MACGAMAFGKRFRIYSLATLAVVMVFNGLAPGYVPQVEEGQPTPFIGLDQANHIHCLLRVADGVGRDPVAHPRE